MMVAKDLRLFLAPCLLRLRSETPVFLQEPQGQLAVSCPPLLPEGQQLGLAILLVLGIQGGLDYDVFCCLVICRCAQDGGCGPPQLTLPLSRAWDSAEIWPCGHELAMY